LQKRSDTETSAVFNGADVREQDNKSVRRNIGRIICAEPEFLEKILPGTNFFTTNPLLTALGLNPGVRCQHLFLYIFFGATAPIGPGPPHSRSF